MEISIFKEAVRNKLYDLKYIMESDEHYNKRLFKKEFGKEADFVNPQTFSEKLLFLKMHYNNLLQNACSDKFTVTEYIKQCGYPEILKTIYAVYLDPDQIDLNKLPERFFIQCSHTQGFNYVVTKDDEKKIDYIKKMYKVILKRNHYKNLRENCYKNIVPRIICSEYLEEPGRETLTDYKFYCFAGEMKYFMVSYGEFNHAVKNHKFDPQWNSIDHLFKKKQAVAPENIQKPENFSKMVEIAEKLSRPFPHARVDLYNIAGRIVFGEITFYSAGGFVHVASDEMDREIGSWINIENFNEYMV